MPEHDDPNDPTNEQGESVIWRDTPSQWMEWPSYFGAVLLLVAFIGLAVVSNLQSWPGWTTWAFIIAQALPVIVIAWTFAKVATVQFELSTQRIKRTTGIFSRELEEIELYRVRDIANKRSLPQLLLGCATITLQTSDSTCPTLTLPWMSSFRDKQDAVRNHVEKCRLKHRARVVEFEGDDLDGDLV